MKGIIGAGTAAHINKSLFIRLAIAKLQRIGGAKLRVVLDKGIPIEKVRNALSRLERKMMATLRADVLISAKLALQDNFRTIGAALPEAVGSVGALPLRQRRFFSGEPSHGVCPS